MTEFAATKPGLAQRGWALIHWVLVVPLGTVAVIALLGMNAELSAPGAPSTLYLISAGLLAVVAIAMVPPVFFRLAKPWKTVTYLGVLVAFIFWGTMLGKIQDAYERTPQGAKLAEERAIAEEKRARVAAEKSESDMALASASAQMAQLEEIMEQQEDCLSWGRELSDLNDVVREGLHNPSSFKHVETKFIIPEADRMNVLLEFRAENGFGAVRTAYLKAQMIPASCEIVQIGEPIAA